MAPVAKLRARSYAIYYGFGPLPGLDQFDLVVLEPQGWALADIRRLQSQGVKVLAYVSALEVPPWFRAVPLSDKDFILVDGKPWVRAPENNRVVRPGSRAWRNYLDQHFPSLYRQGWDGVFLDTLGDIEDSAVAEEADWLAPEAVDLVRLARSYFSDRLVMMNNGLWRLAPLATDHLDGVCWEGTFSRAVLREPWCQAMLDFLGQMTQRLHWVNLMLTQIPVTVQSDVLVKEFQDLARQFGFLPYAAPGGYHEGIRLRDGRVLDGIQKS